MTTYRPTPRSLIRTKFPNDLQTFEELISQTAVEALVTDNGILTGSQSSGSEQYIPRMLAFEIVNDERRKQNALKEVGLFLKLIRAFVRFTNRLEVSSRELWGFSKRNDIVAQFPNEWGPGLDVVLAKDFPKYITSISTSPGLVDSYSREGFIFSVSEQIEKFENIELAWSEELENRRNSGLLFSRCTPTPASARYGKFNANRLPTAPIPAATEFAFIVDPRLRALVERDYAELQRIKRTEAVKSRFVLSGGIIEALLLDALLPNQSAAVNTVSGKKERRSLEEWGLGSLLDAAVELRIITSSAQSFGHSVREFRNLVHPGLERRSNLKVEAEEAQIAENVLAIVIRDLAKRQAQAALKP